MKDETYIEFFYKEEGLFLTCAKEGRQLPSSYVPKNLTCTIYHIPYRFDYHGDIVNVSTVAGENTIPVCSVPRGHFVRLYGDSYVENLLGQPYFEVHNRDGMVKVYHTVKGVTTSVCDVPDGTSVKLPYSQSRG